MRIREPSWTTIGVALICGVLYFLGLYTWAFWVVVLGTVLLAFGTVTAVANPESLLEKHVRGKVFLPEETMMISQYIVRAIILIIFLVAAWNLASLAGYLGEI
ncbi:MAG: hypothetical protein AB7F74_08560 [Parvibaculaceae bacterium]